MALRLEIGAKGDLSNVEKTLTDFYRRASAAVDPETNQVATFEARIASNLSGFLFKEQWAGMAVSPGLRISRDARVLAWGAQNLNEASDSSFQTSMPALLALQQNAAVAAQGSPDVTVDAQALRRYIVEQRRGVLGTGSWREIIELDPEASVAPVLNRGSDRRARFFEVVRSFMADMEVGAMGRRMQTQDIGYRRTALEFLLELHSNGWEHASEARGVRILRVAKHFYPRVEDLQAKAGEFGELANYIRSQGKPTDQVNLVEAGVSDFGPGILDGFLQSSAGRRYTGRDPAEIMDLLLHRKLSRKAADPNAGLGILNALQAAKAMFGFVSLRTGKFWFTMDGSTGGSEARLVQRPGTYPRVDGTHWQLLYPDLTVG
jgi:hypothetical protein